MMSFSAGESEAAEGTLIDFIRSRSIFFSASSACACAKSLYAALFFEKNSKLNVKNISSAPLENADVLIVSSFINAKSKELIIQMYNKMKNPKYIVALGNCPSLNEEYSYNALSLDDFLPVDLYIPYCPPSPKMILRGFEKIRELIKRGGVLPKEDANTDAFGYDIDEMFFRDAEG